MKRLIARAYLVLMVHSKVGPGGSGGSERVREGQRESERSGGSERVILQITTIPELYTQTGAGRRVLPSFDDLGCIKR